MAGFCLHCMEPLGAGYPCSHCGATHTPDNAPHQLPAGTLLKNHLLVGRALGQGGFGITYIGRDLTLDTRIAIKEYYLSNCSSRVSQASHTITVTGENKKAIFEKCKRRFLDEARILERYRREKGIVNVRDYFEDNGTAYIVMEYLDGETLQSRIRRGTLPSNWVFESFQPVMNALARMHQDAVIHRDISPDNIMVLKDGSLCLMDFGAARHLSNGNGGSVTVMHKAGYAPIEQYNGSRNLGPWTDIYALCATMYACITGKRPSASISRQTGRVAWPSEMRIPITPTQEAVLQRGMAIDPADRFQSISEMQDALRAQPIYSNFKRSRQQSRRHGGSQAQSVNKVAFCPKCGEPIPQGSSCPHCAEKTRMTAIVALATVLIALIATLCIVLAGAIGSGKSHESTSSTPITHSSRAMASSSGSSSSGNESGSAVREFSNRDESVILPSSTSSSIYYYEEDESEDWDIDDFDSDDGVADAYGWTGN